MNQTLLILAGAVVVLAVSYSALCRFVGGRTPVRHERRKMLPWFLCVFFSMGVIQLGSAMNNELKPVADWFCLVVLGLLAVGTTFGNVRFARVLPRLMSRRTLARIEQLVREERLAELEQEMRQEIEQEGPTAERLGVFAGCLSRQNKWDEALEVYRQLNERDDTAGLYLSLEGFVLWKLGRAEEGLALLEQVVRKHPKESLGLMRYAQVLAGLGKLDEAEQTLARAEQLYAPYRDSRGAWRLGWVKLLAETRDQVERARILATSHERDA